MNYEEIVNLILVYLLCSLRLTGLIFANPLFSLPSWPMPVKLWLALMLALVMVPSANPQVPVALLSTWTGVTFFAVREFLIGASVGFLAALPLYALQLSGYMEGSQMGLAMATLFDPAQEGSVALVGQMKYLLGIWFLFHWNGHLLLVEALDRSFALVPLGKGFTGIPASQPLGRWLTELFLLGIRLSLPIMGALLLADIGLGFVARTVPQMNVFILGIPLKIGLGLILLMVVMPLTVDLFYGYVSRALVWALEGTVLWR
ncbi:flagellar biosynthetic protein FliR [Thermanaerovibrio velox DSM 12556]|uniref:Flagellar biosynthetic protein FliR n=1 Tax=Thermanaerovibrio velox DSM 12556 TaxID=926567 RepID=H0UPY0_9BACT|nr:flagellar biosynthetic protein FliR [Thermanaerovibrio velox]EHM09609.1 flagellar biosynthetic protein FliR [Thermanaerovibrio velox DSM 12556]